MAEPTQLAFRTLKGIGMLNAAPVYETLPDFERPEGTLRCSIYSPDGKFFAWASPDQVLVVDASTGAVVTTLPANNVFELGFSPLGTYIITWQRPSKDDNGDAVKNLKVWRTLDHEANDEGERDVVGKYVQKNQTGWNLQYTSDEQFCARVVTNEVQFYRSDDLSAPWNRLRVEGVTDFEVAPGKGHSVAVFVPERKGMPAAVKVFNVPNFEAPVSQKTFFKGDKVQLKWNALGTSLIVLAQTDVDKSNRSYYGETTMYILSSNGVFDSRIDLDKEGPIHDVTWSPSSNEFGVVYGYMPAKTTIFNTKAVPVHSFPLAPRNTVLFSPLGRFVLVAGFGNLNGQTDIYDMQKNFLKVATLDGSNASVCEWSPDAKHILMATTSPRLRVDNGIRIWHMAGGMMYKEDMNELYSATWRPQPNSPLAQQDPFINIPAPHESALAYLGTVKTPSKPAGAYRPPGARGTITPVAYRREDEGGAAHIGGSVPGASSSLSNGFRPRRRDVPGAETVDAAVSLPLDVTQGSGVSLNGDDENLSKAALKNKKKRESKKAKDATHADQNGSPVVPATQSDISSITPPPGFPTRQPRREPRQQTEHDSTYTPSATRSHRQTRVDGLPAPREPASTAILEPMPLPLPPQAPAPVEEIMSPVDAAHDKKVRALIKKLRAIEELKMRQAGGEKLELSQVSKIQTEDVVRRELMLMTLTSPS